MTRRTITLTLISLIGRLNIADAQAAGDSLAAYFSRYQSQVPQEKLFVHVDKTFYLAGETIWFKLYSVDAHSNVPLSWSGAAYVEVLNGEQKAMLQEKIEIADGKGNGCFHIPSSIPSGHFIFRAYTNWMKNFSADLYFHQQITILNTLSEISDSTPKRIAGDTVQLFPEGGNLVNGLPSMIAFKAVNNAGAGVICHGVILDQRQDTVARFSSNRFGTGTFWLTPAKGATYYARAETPSSVITQKLPSAYDQGYVMHVDRPGNGDLRISVTTAATPVIPVLYLLVHSRGRLKIIKANYLQDNKASFSISIDSLDDGISQLTVFDGSRLPVCERLWCKPSRRLLHIAVNLTPDDACDPRQKISIGLSTSDPSGHPVPANLSMSVFLLDSLQAIPEENITDYLLLCSDLKGRIESPGAYFKESDPAAAEALDDLMLTQGWIRFRWEDILRDKKPYFSFLPETSGLLVEAKLVDKRTNLPPAAPVIGYLSALGKPFALAATVSHADGTLNFRIGKFYGPREIILQTNGQIDSNFRIDLVNSFSDRFSWLPSQDSLFPRNARSQLLYRSINVQAENAYRRSEKQRLLPLPAGDTTPFYGHADLGYNLDDYTRFITMDEVIREFVQDVRVRRSSGKSVFRVRNALFNLFFEDDPLLLVDGVPIFNADKIMAINPLKIAKIDVIAHRYHFGPSISDGIISFLSYEDDLGGLQLDPSAVVIQYSGLQQHQEFYSPVYASAAPGPLPDLRDQLFWSPDINTDVTGKKQLSFYTSDLKGKFALVVQGLTNSGLPGYSVNTFTVR